MNPIFDCCICTKPVRDEQYVMVLRMNQGISFGQANLCHTECWDKAREEAWRNR